MKKKAIGMMECNDQIVMFGWVQFYADKTKNKKRSTAKKNGVSNLERIY